jgi:hypothetical protein
MPIEMIMRRNKRTRRRNMRRRMRRKRAWHSRLHPHPRARARKSKIHQVKMMIQALMIWMMRRGLSL